MLAINEIFYSIQGEGDFAGQPMVFIRLAGCNLRCDWCDQPDTISNDYVDQAGMQWLMKYTKLDEEAILDQVSNYPTRYVCITGGEPLTHKLSELIRLLHEAKKLVHMESNGTLNPKWLPLVDHLVVSPKAGHKTHPMLPEGIVKELKFIVDAEFTISTADEYHRKLPHASLYLQPANRKDRINIVALQRTMALVLENPRYRLSPQIHKLIGAH
jgi:7-carboxy-7-deazaguanine synthase